MRIHIDHITKYEFSMPARQLIQILRMTPQNNPNQNIVSWDINIDCDAKLNRYFDAYGNLCHVLAIDGQINNLTIETIGTIDTNENSGILGNIAENFPPQVFCRFSPLATPDAAIIDFAKSCEKNNNLATAHEIMGNLHQSIKFEIGSTSVITDAKTAFAAKSGVCQDQAHIFIAACRSLKIPARYISGHLLRQDGNDLQEAAHAWAECYIENLGWVAFDPVNGICTDEHYVRVAFGLDYRDAAPLSGSRIGGGVETLSVGLHVRNSQNQ